MACAIDLRGGPGVIHGEVAPTECSVSRKTRLENATKQCGGGYGIFDRRGV